MRDSIPSGWRPASLGELVEECNDRVGVGPKPIVLSSTKHHGLVPSDEYFRGRTIYSDDLSGYKRVERNWFAYATNHLAEGSIGLQDHYDSACVSPIYTVFKCRDGIDPHFIYRILKSPELITKYAGHEQASVDRRGAVRYRDFSTITVTIPGTLAEQRRIEEILNSVDAAILSTEATIAKSGLAWQAIMGSRFDEAASLPDTRIFTLDDIANYVNGYAFKPEDWGNVGLPIIRIQNINGSKEYNFYKETIDPTFIVEPGDLLFAWSGTRDSSFGPTIWKGPRGLLNQHIFKVTEKPMLVDRDFLYILLRMRLDRIASSAHGFKESFVHVKRSDLVSLPVAVPSKEEQRRIVVMARSEQIQRDVEQRRLGKLRQTRVALLRDLLSGEVRVTDGLRRGQMR